MMHGAIYKRDGPLARWRSQPAYPIVTPANLLLLPAQPSFIIA